MQEEIEKPESDSPDDSAEIAQSGMPAHELNDSDGEQFVPPSEAVNENEEGSAATEEDTVSILDLMREVGDSAREEKDFGREETPEHLQPAEDYPASPTDEVTPADPSIPSVLIPLEPPPLPLASEELIPPDIPPLEDADATKVQPRSAFPGRTQLSQPPEINLPERSPEVVPISEQPTEPPRPVPEQKTVAIKEASVRPTREPVRDSIKVVIPDNKRKAKPRKRRRWTGCLSQFILISIIVIVAGILIAIAAASAGYIVIASQLPPPSELRQRASSFETAQILDRNGNLLYSLADPETGNRTRVSLDEIDQDLQNATIATEDARFYTNPGFDPLAISRAIIDAALEGEASSGASTITQQLARALLLDEEERTQRTFSRKVKEIILAAELFRTYSKEEILELYLNEINYGNRAYGIEAAARTYFNKSAANLSLAEASLLAGLPQAPALWDPYTAPEQALGRQREVLRLMIAEGMINRETAQATIEESAPNVRSMQPPKVTIRHPHFTVTVLQQLEEQFGAQAIYQGGLRIFTTLDPTVQRLAEETVTTARGSIVASGANNAALVAIQPVTGEVLALVGSFDYNDESISGQVNMALAPRQPGSSIKPLVYLSAMEDGWTPSTLIWDVPTDFPDRPGQSYSPKNYDDQFHGPLRMRPALGNSYNIPAVKALEYVGVCRFIDRMRQLGLESLQDQGCVDSGTPREYGLALALGGGEISPLEMAGAFAILANGGKLEQPFTITHIENRVGDIIFEHKPAGSSSSQIVRSEHAYLLSDILSDNNARQPEFSSINNLVIQGHRVAAKTGTSGTDRFDVRDGWTIGYTPEIVTAVWVGNTDNEPVHEGQSGYQLASPLWNSFMGNYLATEPAANFQRPPGIAEAEICADSGARPGPGCKDRIVEVFAGDQLPTGSDQDFLRPQKIDLWTNLVANEFCPESIYEANFFNLVVNGREEVLDRERQSAREWLEQTSAGKGWADAREIAIPLRLAPENECDDDTPRPEAVISHPYALESISGELEIRGTARGPNYGGYLVDYGLSHDPLGWGWIQDMRSHMVDNDLLARWDTSELPGGPATIRLLVFGPDNPFTSENDPVMIETRVEIIVLEPTSTPTSTPTLTPTPTETPTPTTTPSPSPTGTSSATPTSTPVPTETLNAEPPATATSTQIAPVQPPATATNTPES